ncbi:MFS transporter [Variovorax terrae]|uniref:MFS transporter n=1 Tax=Variovorax terrae TaxID=2923278 RepID=A0A9X1W0E8_9BURK|nr:MFS transporter [Variovorax terrae]MCJ0765509.1 MFS transporter [Variovorax terrae]
MKPLSLPDVLTPLRQPAFRLLWLTWAAANVCMWMNDMAAAWLMTSLTTSATMIALVQTAATLPVFMLSMPSGVLADLFERRAILIATQVWAAAAALVLAAAASTGHLEPHLLLALVFANGAALAMRGPAFVATVPDIVNRAEWPKAFALTGVASHGARIVGPIVAGLVIGAAGAGAVFALNAAIAMLTAVSLWRLRGLKPVRALDAQALPREPFFTALRVGLQYAAHTDRVKMILLRVLAFYLAAVGLLALLPAVVKGRWMGGAGTYTAMFAVIGAGAIAVTWLLPRLRARASDQQLLAAAVLGYAAALAIVAIAPQPWQAAPALALAGAAWMLASNQFITELQSILPSWVRARGVSCYHTVLMAGNAGGALLWGRLADTTGLRTSLLCAAVATAALVVLIAVTDRASLEEDITPDAFQPVAGGPVATAASGRVFTTIEYRVAARDHAEFCGLMQATRKSRLRSGALGWKLLRDAADSTHFVEAFSDVSWTEMRRRMQRSVAHDKALRDRRHALHMCPGKPRVRILLTQPHQTSQTS